MSLEPEKNRSVVKLCIAALLLATAVVLPQALHMAGGPASGKVLLPMHIPVLMAGLLLGGFYGLLVGVSAPVLSALFTGMPHFARLPFMVVELAAYGFFSGLFSSKKLPVYLSLIGAQVAGRLCYGAALYAAVFLFRINVSAVGTLSAIFIAGLPGIAAQLLLVPPMVYLIRKKVIPGDRLDS